MRLRSLSPFLIVGVLVLVGAAWVVPLPERLLQPGSAVVRFRDGLPAHVFLSPDEKWRMAADAVDPAYVEALVRLEDRRFWWHPGVDPVALLRATALNAVRGRVVSGGSTLTMQLVRVLEPRPRTMSSKIVEVVRALQLELRLSKREILAAYLTYAPYGKNIEGIEAASWSYFGHGASALSPAEVATLLAVPQRPNARMPSPTHVETLTRARDGLADRLAAWGVLRDAAGGRPPSSLYATPVPSRLRAFPRRAPHAAFWLKDRLPAEGGITTLDAGIQKQVEGLAASAARRARDQGVRNHAVAVVDNATGDLVALVGGLDFFDAEHGSQIPAFLIPRSPGSALKPLIYALAIDRGLALPGHMVEDVPKDFGGYSPKNFDGQYAGLVTLDQALAQSLNVPFVNLLERLGVERFLGVLATSGAPRLTATPGRYGLSAAIGGLELSPLELLGLYAAIANDGLFRELRAIPASTPEASKRTGLSLLSPGAAFLTRGALRLRDRPDFPRRRDVTKTQTNVFWKTGTSFGHKDAWAVGGTSRYSAVVWFGNVTYAPSHALVGADLAAPLLFDVLEGLEGAGSLLPDSPPEDLARVEVCAYSGHLPGPGCTHRRTVFAPRANVPSSHCPYHVELDVDDKSGLAVKASCRADLTVTRRRYMVWPTGVKRFLNETQRTLPEPPSLHPSCRETQMPSRLAISSPRANHVTLLVPGLPAERQEIPFEAETSTLSGELSWFVNGEFIGRRPAAERVWWTPRPGVHEITVTDGLGLLARRTLEVRAR